MSETRTLWAQADLQPDKVAVVTSGGEIETFGDIAKVTNRISNALLAQGIRPGETVAGAITNRAEALAVYAACVQIGLYYVPMNSHLGADEIAYILTDAKCQLLVGDERIADVCTIAADSAGIPQDRRVAVGSVPGFRKLDDFIDTASDTRPEHLRLGNRMPYTSGTTGRPKGVRWLLPEDGTDVDATISAAVTGLFAGYGMPTDASGVHLIAGPLHHQAPLAFGYSALMLGNTVVLMEKWGPEATLSLIQDFGVTTTHLVPTMFHRMLLLPQSTRDGYDVSSLRKVLHAAAPCPIDTKRKMIEWLGPIVDEYYAASEGGGTYVSAEEWLRRPGTVGRAKKGSAVKVLNEERDDCKAGEIGTVFLLITQPFEYHNDPKKTAESRHEGYFNVGDIGYLDPEGYLYLQDRKSNVIISGGVNIYPAEVENLLSTHPAVADVAVFGVPNDEWGEEVKAVVQRVGTVGTERELIDFCRVHLAHFKCPRSIDFVDELPRLDNGKLYKRELRDAYWRDAGRLI
jgi:long-chain acyl-CoA synthetase